MNYFKIYHNLPYILKYLAFNIKTFLNYRKRFFGNYNKYLNEYLELWYNDMEIINNYQKKQLIKLLKESYKHSKWYKDKMDNLNITYKQIEIDPYEVLSKMPILKKNERKDFVKNIINTNKDRKTITIDFTSGTSGSPTINYLDKESIERSFALWKRFHYVIGIKEKQKNVRFSGKIFINPNKKKPPFWMYNIFEKQLFMSTYHLTEKNILYYLKKLNEFKPFFLDGYPSALFILAKYINKNQIKLKFKPFAIMVTAETLYEYQRKAIEKAFNCKVYNQYASSEGSPFITECSENKLHLNLDSGIFEFFNKDDKKAKPGEIARLVVTSFRNLKTPLIRYDIGDTVLLPEKEIVCDCGCKMPVVKEIIGREDDILWTEEKGFVGRMDTAFKGLKGIDKTQIIQKSPTLFEINIIVDDTYTQKDEVLFLKNLQERLGKNVHYKLNYVNDIPLGSNGKFIAVKRKFKLKDYDIQ